MTLLHFLLYEVVFLKKDTQNLSVLKRDLDRTLDFLLSHYYLGGIIWLRTAIIGRAFSLTNLEISLEAD